jgi:endonuclease/exonuclease/phosphatase family metal-dependent hydrolase
MIEQDSVTAERIGDGSPAARPGRAIAARQRLRRWLRPRRRWCWGTRLVVAATVAWLLLLVAHLVLSGRTSLWAPVDLLPPVVWAAGPAALLVFAPLARPVRWRLIATLLVAGLLGGGISGINLATLWHTPPPPPPGAVTVVAWNTEFWDQAWQRGGDGYEPDFYRHLRELDADVYLLMEYLHVREPLSRENAFRIDRQARLRVEFPGYHIAVAEKQITLSRFPIVQQYGVDMSPWLPEEMRVIPPGLEDYPGYLVQTLRTDLRVAGTVVSFYNTHLSQPPVKLALHRPEAREEAQDGHLRRAASLRALAADVEGNPNPVVVGADLNTSPSMGILRLLPDALADNTRALESVYPHSWPAAGRRQLWRIDWLLTTPDVTVHRYELRDPAGMSDHRIQRAVLSLS